MGVRSKLRTSHLVIVGGILALFLAAGWFDQPRPVVAFLEQKGLDLRFRLRGERPPTGQVVVAGIETRGIEAYGRWPWPRSVFAQLLVRLKDYGAQTVVFDLLFPEPEENRTRPVLESLQQSFVQLGLKIQDFPNQIFHDEMDQLLAESDNDALFSEALAWSGNGILGTAFEGIRDDRDFSASRSLVPTKKTRLLEPVPDLKNAARGLGFVNIFPDSDGTIRRVRLVNKDHLCLALAGAAHYLDTVVRAGDGRVVLTPRLPSADPDLPDQGILVPDAARSERRLATDGHGNVRLNFYGLDPGFDRVSIADIIDGAISPDRLAGKVVIVGAMATGIGDIWPTPLTSEIPGVFIQATLLDNILENRLLQTLPHMRWVKTGSILVLVLLPLGFMMLFTPMASLAAGVVLMGTYAAGVQYLFQTRDLVWPLMLPLGAGLTTVAALLITNFAAEIRQHRWVKTSFSRYLSPAVIDILIRHPDQLTLGGEEKELTVLMADIRNFTTLSESLSPSGLIELLNRYLGTLTDVILENGGTLDKYMGDAIMAFFGAPLDDTRHPQKACLTAIRMFERLEQLQAEWERQGVPILSLGMGLSTGQMVVGNLGSRRRFDYSVIGDNVNLASRLEGLCKIYGVKIIIPEQTRMHLDGAFVCRELDRVRVKGRQAPVTIYELIGQKKMGDPVFTWISHFENGLACYRNQDFGTAIRHFEDVLGAKPKDRPARLFITRCRTLIQTPETCSPLLETDEWDGVWTFTEK
jgi:adenylate cyclase